MKGINTEDIAIIRDLRDFFKVFFSYEFSVNAYRSFDNEALNNFMTRLMSTLYDIEKVSTEGLLEIIVTSFIWEVQPKRISSVMTELDIKKLTQIQSYLVTLFMKDGARDYKKLEDFLLEFPNENLEKTYRIFSDDVLNIFATNLYDVVRRLLAKPHEGVTYIIAGSRHAGIQSEYSLTITERHK